MDIIRRHDNTRISDVKKALVEYYDVSHTFQNIPLFCVQDTKIRPNESKILNLHVSLNIPDDVKSKASLAVVHGIGRRYKEYDMPGDVEPVVTVVGDPLERGDPIKLDIWNCTESTIYIPAGSIVATVIIESDV